MKRLLSKMNSSNAEQGTYGALPQRPPVYQIKERKPKVYSSYSVSDKCSVHGKNLKKQVPQTSLKTLIHSSFNIVSRMAKTRRN